MRKRVYGPGAAVDVRQIVAPGRGRIERATLSAFRIMVSDTDTDQAAAWYLAATPGSVSQWLARLWRTSAALDVVVLATAFLLPAGSFPLRRLAPLLAATALVGAERASRRAGAGARSRAMTVAHLLLQVALLTGLLELSGGPSNAFSVIYVVQVALATVTLGAGWAAVVGGWATLCYGLLIFWHLEELVPAHHRLIDFPTQLFAMWLAISTLAELAAHFIGAASRAVARREHDLERMREQAAHTQRLVSLTTLAAGAAHELSTPLATIAIASKELERALAAAPGSGEYAADARLIREEVDRCQLILDQMSGRAGGSAAEAAEPVRIDTVLADVTARLTPDAAGRLHTWAAPALPTLVVPRAGLVQVLLSLIKNALDATHGADPVTLDIDTAGGQFTFVVQDRGDGMSPDTLRRAGEPFYTTKDAGQGTGLGVFLARAFAERCGGSLSLQSGQGTTAVLTLPATPARIEVAS
jgi:two-component system sensor histidine kinase RegB